VFAVALDVEVPVPVALPPHCAFKLVKDVALVPVGIPGVPVNKFKPLTDTASKAAAYVALVVVRVELKKEALFCKRSNAALLGGLIWCAVL
jgi:hypothetical protein